MKKKIVSFGASKRKAELSSAEKVIILLKEELNFLKFCMKYFWSDKLFILEKSSNKANIYFFLQSLIKTWLISNYISVIN